jgi:hypothetical protein
MNVYLVTPSAFVPGKGDSFKLYAAEETLINILKINRFAESSSSIHTSQAILIGFLTCDLEFHERMRHK